MSSGFKFKPQTDRTATGKFSLIHRMNEKDRKCMEAKKLHPAEKKIFSPYCLMNCTINSEKASFINILIHSSSHTMSERLQIFPTASEGESFLTINELSET